MGRLAELFEKKANGSITDEELKEYNQLLKEAELVSSKTKEEEKEDEEADAEEDTDEDVDKMAQAFADKVTDKISSTLSGVDKLVESLKFVQSGNEGQRDPSKTFIMDKSLGRKSITELENIKIAVPGRKELGKKITEVSAKTCQFVAAMVQGDKQKLQLLSEGTAGMGGYLVPDEYANMIIEDIRDLSVMRTIAAPAMTTTSDTLHIPKLSTRPKAAFRSEKAVKNTSTAQFDENSLTPYSLAVIVGLSNELAADASLGVNGSVVNYVAGLMAQSIAEREDKAFFVGNGTGQPSGIDGGVYTLPAVAAVISDVGRADAITQMFLKCPQGYRSRGSFVMNSATLQRVATLKDGDNNYLLTRLADSPSFTLRGRPVYEQNDLAGGTIIFGDFGYYQIVDREGINIRISDEATVASYSAFERNLTFIRVEKRVDAECLLTTAFVKGTQFGQP
jgi:HK97 family phage major capsid protein